MSVMLITTLPFRLMPQIPEKLKNGVILLFPFLWMLSSKYVLWFLQRSALAYRRDSSIDGYINRTNVGISTTSTTSRSTSKSSGGLYKGDDYLRSTDTSTSGHAPSYAYDNAYHQKSGEGQCFDFFFVNSVLFVFEGTDLSWWDRCYEIVIALLLSLLKYCFKWKKKLF